MKKQILSFVCSLCFWSLTVGAAQESTKGVLLNSAQIDSSSVVAAQLAELSPDAIERGLKDVQLLARPKYDNKSKVFSMEWHSMTKTINGTEHSKSLSEPLATQLKFQEGVSEVSVGQTVTIKGDLESMLEDFDALLRDAQNTTEINSEKTVDASVTNNDGGELGNGGSSGGSSGGGYLSDGGLTENPNLEDGGITVDKITSTSEKCSLNVDWSTMNTFQQERVIKKSTETGETTDIGECYNIGQANKIEKDYSATCNIQINGLQSYAKGFIYYSYVDGNRVNLSGCRYESEEAEPLLIKHDFDACNLGFAETNLAENKYYPAAVKYSIINGERYNLTECEVIATAPQPLPTRIESCDITHSIEEMTSFTMQRVDVYDPQDKELLKKGECQRHISFPILKDYEAGCSIQFNEDGSFIKGFKYYSTINNKRYDISSCEYDESELKQANILKDFDACSLNYAKVNAQEGTFNPAFIKYTLVDGKRYDLSGCETSIEEVKPLPVHTEVCELEHSIPELKTYRMERKDIYDPADKARLIEGDCYSIEEITIQRDFDAGCALQVNATFNTYTRGYKFFSTVDNKKHVLSECEYNSNDAMAFDRFKDYSACSLDEAVIDIANSNYQPSFTQYTLIDNNRYELSGCMNDVTDTRPLPTRKAQCDVSYDFVANKAFDMERVDIYDPANKVLLKEGDCYPTGNFDIARDYNVYSCVNLPDYSNKLLARSYRSYIMRDNKKEWVSECTLDLENKVALLQETGACKATENLSSSTDILNKKWYWVKEDGSNEYITDCVSSDETYPIVITENTCSPTFLAGSNKVVIQNRKGWVDSNNDWHYVTECTTTSTEAEVKTEVCASPKYEHDFVGGQSYLRTRNYYTHNGNKTYINACSRDGSTSFPHTKSTSGCSTQHDDANFRSRLFTKTMANLQEGATQLKGCEAENQYVPYVLTATINNEPWGVFNGSHVYNHEKNNGDFGGNVNSYSSETFCNITKSWFSGFSWGWTTSGEVDWLINRPGWITTATRNVNVYQRVDGSQYRLVTRNNCLISSPQGQYRNPIPIPAYR